MTSRMDMNASSPARSRIAAIASSALMVGISAVQAGGLSRTNCCCGQSACTVAMTLIAPAAFILSLLLP